MRRRRLPFVSILTSIILLFTFLGFFVTSESRMGEIKIGRAVLGLQWTLIQWAVIITACAVLLGFLNVLAVHIGKLASRSPGWFYSLALIVSAAVVLGLGVGEMFVNPEDGLWGPFVAPIFIWVIAPLQAATSALLLFILTYAAYRMLRQNQGRGAFIFLISALVVLVTRLPLTDLGSDLEEFRQVWFSWLAIPGLRAVLIGVALGIAMTALRLIMGIDRPQG